MLSEGEDIKLDVTQKTYKLIVATKQLIARKEDLDAVIKLSISNVFFTFIISYSSPY